MEADTGVMAYLVIMDTINDVDKIGTRLFEQNWILDHN